MRMTGGILIAMMSVGAVQAQHEALFAPPDKIELGGPEVVVPLGFFGNRPVVDVMLDGKGPYKFILDTGAAGSVVDEDLANELKMKVLGKTELSSPVGHGGVAGHVVKIGRFGMGQAVATGVPASTMALTSMFRDKDAPRGVMSASMFRGYLLTLDYPRNEVRLRPGALPAADGAEVFEYDAFDHLPTVTISVAGVEATAHLDSGSPGGLTLSDSYAVRLPLAAPPVAAGKMRTVDREMTVTSASLNGSVKLGRHLFENPEIRFVDADMGNIGYKFLSRFAVTLDAANHRVRLEDGSSGPAATGAAGTPAGPAPQPAAPPHKRYGYKVAISPEGLEITGTEPDSIAAKAGLQPGDKIVGVNGRKLEELDHQKVGEMLRASPLTLQIDRAGKSLEFRMSLD